MNDIDRLRDAWLSGDTGKSEDCPDPDVLWQAVRDELNRAATARGIDHVATCPECAHGWQLAKDVAAGSAPPAMRRAARGPVRSRWLWGGLAAAAAVTLMLVILPDVEHDPQAPILREGRRAAIESLISEETILSRDEVVLRWSPGPAGSLYDVVVTDEDLRRLDGSESLERSEFRVPADALRRLEPGNLPSVTGARDTAILGGVYWA